MKKYVPKKITESEIKEIQDSVERAHMRIRTMSPEIKPHFKRIFKLATEDGDDSVTAQQIINEFSLLLIRGDSSKLNDPRTKKILNTALTKNDQNYIHKLSKALKSPAKFHITPTENFLLFFWTWGSFSFADKDSFPPLVVFTVKDLTRLIQVVLGTNGVTESSLEATIGRKLRLKTIKHCKVTTAQADRWIQQFQAYKTNHSAQIKDRFDMWGNFLKEQQLLNACCIENGVSPTQAKELLEFYLNNRETLRRHFRGKYSDFRDE